MTATPSSARSSNANQLAPRVRLHRPAAGACECRRRREPQERPRRRLLLEPTISPGCARTTRRSRTRSSARSSPSSGSPTRPRRWPGPMASTSGLASSVWTKDFGRAMRMSKAMDFGCVWINTHIPLVAEMPHGGYKKSGTAGTCRCTGSGLHPHQARHGQYRVLPSRLPEPGSSADHRRPPARPAGQASPHHHGRGCRMSPTPRFAPRDPQIQSLVRTGPSPATSRAGSCPWPGLGAAGGALAACAANPTGGRQDRAQALRMSRRRTRSVNWANWTAVPRLRREDEEVPDLEEFIKKTGITGELPGGHRGQ